VDVEGSSYRLPEARMLIKKEKQTIVGTISGGFLRERTGSINDRGVNHYLR
jgi:xanthine/CO dehydrogenase XdhC/CoxF family maturation factor